jgi:hypothetical protein
MEAGWEALKQQIQKNIARGLTLEEFFGGKPSVYQGFAPTKDRNNPVAYADTVAKMLQINPNIPLNQLQPAPTKAETQTAIAPTARYDQPPTSIIPDWFSATPTWMQDAPAWYSLMPKWLQSAGSSIVGSTVYNTPLDVDVASPTPIPGVRPTEDLKQYLQRPAGASSSTSSQQQTITIKFGDINIMQPNMSEDQIKGIVSSGVMDALKHQTMIDLAQLNPSY